MKARAPSGPVPGSGALADELLEAGLIADGVEVRVLDGQLAERLPSLDRPAEMLDRVRRPTGQALAARQVVERRDVVGMCLEDLERAVRSLRISACLIERIDLRPTSQPTATYGLPSVAPMASTVVPDSSAKAVRVTPGCTWTKVPAGASTDSPSSSKRTRPSWTK